MGAAAPGDTGYFAYREPGVCFRRRQTKSRVLPGLYFYNLIFGYMWLVPISTLGYEHLAAMISALLSAIAFLLPAVFICRPAPRIAALSAAAHDRLLDLVLIVGVAIVAVGAFYNFRIVGLAQIYEFREGIEFPALFRYALNMTSTALLPFAFGASSGAAGMEGRRRP